MKNLLTSKEIRDAVRVLEKESVPVEDRKMTLGQVLAIKDVERRLFEGGLFDYEEN